MGSMSPRHHRLRAGLAYLEPVVIHRPHMTRAENGGYAMPLTAHSRTPAPVRYSRQCEAALERIARRRAQQRRRQLEAMRWALVIWAAGLFGAAVMFWAVGILVRVFWVP